MTGAILTSVLFCGALSAQPAGGKVDYGPLLSSGRELQNQMDFLTRAIAGIPGQPEGRGLFKQVNQIYIGVVGFRDQVQLKASRDSLYLSFNPVDRELSMLLSELQTFGKWDPSIRLAARRAESALDDVHQALSAGDAAPERRTVVEARQIQTLVNREADLESIAGLLLYEPDRVKAWNADFAELRKALAELQSLQKKKASRDELKQQLSAADKSWEKLVTRFKGLPASDQLPLREDFGQLDQVFGRLNPMLGIQNRRAALRVNFLP